MNEENKLMEAMNEEVVVEVVEEVATNRSLWKKLAIGLGITGLAIGAGFLVRKAIKDYKAKKTEVVEAEIEEIEE